MNIMNSLTLIVMGAILCGCEPATPEIQLESATAAARAGDWKKADEIISKLRKHNSKNMAVLLLAALAAEKNGKRDLALDCARQAAELSPQQFVAQYTLGRLYSNDITRAPETIQALTKALAIKPGDRNTLILLCNAYAELKSSEALTWLTRLYHKHQKEFIYAPEFYYNCAVAHLRRGDRSKAAGMLNYAAAKGENNPELLFNVARCFERFGWKAQAKKNYRRFLELYTYKLPSLAREAQTNLAHLR